MGTIVNPFDDWELFNTVDTASHDCNQFHGLPLLPVTQWYAKDKDTFVAARQRVIQTKQVQVRDNVRERYTSLGALQLRTATTAPEAW